MPENLQNLAGQFTPQTSSVPVRCDVPSKTQIASGQTRRNAARETGGQLGKMLVTTQFSIHSQYQPRGGIPKNILHLRVGQAFGPSGPFQGAEVFKTDEDWIDLLVFLAPNGRLFIEPDK